MLETCQSFLGRIDTKNPFQSLTDMESMSGALTNNRSMMGHDKTVSGLHSIITEITNGEMAVLERIWATCADELYSLAIWRTGSRAEAEDVVQEVFVRLARSPDRLAAVRNPRAYLLRMTHNAAIDSRKKRGAHQPLDEALQLAEIDPGTEEHVDAQRISALLLDLSDNQREAVFLRIFVGLSFTEIGSATGVSRFTAASRYRLAIRRLRKLLGVVR